MQSYLVRYFHHETKKVLPFLLVVQARDLADLFWAIDEHVDPSLCEFRKLTNGYSFCLDLVDSPDEADGTPVFSEIGSPTYDLASLAGFHSGTKVQRTQPTGRRVFDLGSSDRVKNTYGTRPAKEAWWYAA